MRNTKGMSEVVTTVIFVSLALIAIGIVWAVINGVIQKGASDVTSSGDCLKFDISPTAASCVGVDTSVPVDGTIDAYDCSATLYRKSGGADINGVKMVFRDATGASGNVIGYASNIEALKTVVLSKTNVAALANVGTTAAPTSLDVNVYILDASGNEVICSKTTSFTIA